MNSTVATLKEHPKQRTTMVIMMLLGAFLTLLTETFLNNALPTIMKELSVSQATAQWLSTGYLMVAGLMIPISAWVFKRFDVKWTYLVMMVIFLIGSIIGYLAPTFLVLLIGRLIQAIAAGSLIPLIQNVVLILYPVEKRGAAMGMTGIVVAFAPAIGPTLSGLLIDDFGWRSLFLVLIPLTLIILILGAVFIQHINDASHEAIDLWSLFLSFTGFGSLLYSFSLVGNSGTITLWVILTFIIGCVLIVLFVIRQLKVQTPLIELRVFKNQTFSITSILSAISNISMLGVELVMPLYLQNVHGVSALVSGLTLLPGALVMAVLNPISGQLFDKYGIFKLSLVGYLILGLGTLPMFFFTITTNLYLIASLYAVRMVGIALVMMPTFTAGVNALDQKLAVHGNAASSTVRQIAGSLGTALLMMLVALFSKTANGKTDLTTLNQGYHAAFLVAFLMAVLGLIMTFKLRKKAQD
ncbi:multidrug transporter [Lactobacillus paracollinoides] [Lactiplantibacillus mudanjiangensis]|uniref:MDR family MFS transporter n=1 Tax=Lactiplantibacillus mudanjiangensis TaxID=1296538 RepID=UPI001015B436|nr:multidrug transporter [Lactobacillus paracollinoides] [Lactiplantibacillus mudanjiangensis]